MFKVHVELFRMRVFELIEKADRGDWRSALYDYMMMTAIVVSLIPLAFKVEPPIFRVTDYITAIIFIADYLLRWATADYKFKKAGIRSFLRYPFSLMAIIDLLSVLPSLSIVHSGFQVLRVLRLFRAMRVLRVFKAMRYSRTFKIIGEVLVSSRESLIAVGTLAVGYIIVSALVIFTVEPESFGNFFDAIYWATVSLTTGGYGDIYPVTTIGRFVTMISSIFGIAIVALPAGIITAEYMNELSNNQSKNAGSEKKQ
jgi:voltage-gated potassium channel